MKISNSSLGQNNLSLRALGNLILFGLLLNIACNNGSSNDRDSTSGNSDEMESKEESASKKTVPRFKMTDPEIFSLPVVWPSFEDGGHVGLQKFIKENLKYPQEGAEITGRVYVSYVVDTTGQVMNIYISRSLTDAHNEEAVNLVRKLSFKPATLHGEPVEMEMILPIPFGID